MENEFILKIENLFMKYRKRDTNYVLNDLNFNIKKNSFHAFIGENGAGKSTTIKIIAGLNNDYDGNVIINGLDVKTNIKSRDNFLYVPDKTFFPINLNVFDYLYNTTLLKRNDKEKIKMEINDLLEKFEIKDIAKKNPNKLSAGQIKKISLIQAILMKVNFLVLDEPAAFLDPSTRMLLFKELKRLNQEYHTTIFISSHILDEIKNYIDAASFIRKGKILWSGSVKGEELISKYKEIILGEKDE